MRSSNTHLELARSRANLAIFHSPWMHGVLSVAHSPEVVLKAFRLSTILLFAAIASKSSPKGSMPPALGWTTVIPDLRILSISALRFVVSNPTNSTSIVSRWSLMLLDMSFGENPRGTRFDRTPEGKENCHFYVSISAQYLPAL